MNAACRCRCGGGDENALNDCTNAVISRAIACSVLVMSNRNSKTKIFLMAMVFEMPPRVIVGVVIIVIVSLDLWSWSLAGRREREVFFTWGSFYRSPYQSAL